MRHDVVTICMTVLMATALTGCFDDPDIADVVDAIAWEIEPARLEPEAELRFGRGTISLAQAVCGWVDDCRDYAPLLEGIYQAHVGVYEVRGRYRPEYAAMSEDFRFDLESEGWHVVMRSQDRRGETVMALTKVEAGELVGLYVISLEDEEVVVVKLEGELSRPLDMVLRRDRDFRYAMESVGEEF